jgi:predicted RNA-binding Zn-ribbon protein involved in translation (DUF1610 family)
MSEQPREEKDDRPPICPSCGVTQGIKDLGDDEVEFVCLECGFSDLRPGGSNPGSEPSDRFF